MTEQIEEVLDVPPRDYAVRGFNIAELDGAQFRAADLRDGDTPVMFGYLSVFDEWARVDSRIEGQFMERVAEGSFKNTIKQNRSRIRPIYDHGQDTRFGRHPLGPVDVLEEHTPGRAGAPPKGGAYYEVPLLDNSMTRDLLPGLRAGVYGTSYKFRTVKMDPPVRPRHATDHNPDRWEERTIRELEMVEFGPTPFPVYAGPTAGIRSLTDEFRIAQLGIDPETLRSLLTTIALPEGAAETHSDPASRTPVVSRFRSREDYLAWLSGRA